MIKSILAWLISIYYKPATTAETQTSGVTQMSEPLVDAPVQPVVTAAPVEPVVSAAPVAADYNNLLSPAQYSSNGIVASTTSPLAEFLAKVEAFSKFVEHGIEVLGADAEAELVALKDKYL